MAYPLHAAAQDIRGEVPPDVVESSSSEWTEADPNEEFTLEDDEPPDGVAIVPAPDPVKSHFSFSSAVLKVRGA